MADDTKTLSPAFANLLTDASARFVSEVHLAAGTAPWERRGSQFAPSVHALSEQDLENIAGDLLVSVRDCLPSVRGTRGDGAEVPGWCPHLPSVGMLLGPDGCRWRVEQLLLGGPSTLPWCYAAHTPQTAPPSEPEQTAAPPFGFVFRRVPDRAPTLGDLGVSLARAAHLTTLRTGLVVVCGAAGSGKSTTVASLAQTALDTRQVQVRTVEAPAEHRLRNRTGRALQGSFSSCCDQADRIAQLGTAGCDVAVVGECRTPEEMAAALRLAAGRLVLTSVNAPGLAAVCRLFAAAAGAGGQQMVAELLGGVVTQMLLPDAQQPASRQAAAEVVVIDQNLRTHLRDDDLKSAENAVTKSQSNQQSMAKSLADLVRTGAVRQEDADGLL